MARYSWRAPYSLTDWLHDAGSGGGLPCPRCGHDEDYGLRDDAATATPENVGYYRACKVCGMFQEADGRSDPYETTITVHPLPLVSCGQRRVPRMRDRKRGASVAPLPAHPRCGRSVHVP